MGVLRHPGRAPEGGLALAQPPGSPSSGLGRTSSLGHSRAKTRGRDLNGEDDEIGEIEVVCGNWELSSCVRGTLTLGGAGRGALQVLPWVGNAAHPSSSMCHEVPVLTLLIRPVLRRKKKSSARCQGKRRAPESKMPLPQATGPCCFLSWSWVQAAYRTLNQNNEKCLWNKLSRAEQTGSKTLML